MTSQTKSGAFVDAYVIDPRIENASASKSSVERHQSNQRIIAELSKEYNLELYSDLLMAASCIHNRNPDYFLDFLITDIPPDKQADEWVKERNTEIRRAIRIIGHLTIEGRARLLTDVMEEEGRFTDRVYSTSLWCLGQLHKDLPGLTIIGYTMAPDPVYQRCIDEGSIDHLLLRGEYDTSVEANRLIKFVEAGRNGR
jgi:hypothetical protein